MLIDTIKPIIEKYEPVNIDPVERSKEIKRINDESELENIKYNRIREK